MSSQNRSCRKLWNYVYICWSYAAKNCGLFSGHGEYV